MFAAGKRLPVSVAVVLWLIAAGWGQAQDHKPDCYVLSAGIDHYVHDPKLQGCLNDARNTAAAFRAQQGQLFGKVQTRTLLDGQASAGNIRKRFGEFTQQGKAGDYFVLFLSGHGGKQGDTGWFFVASDQNSRANALTDRQILDGADALVRQGKKVIVIIDACFSGRLSAIGRDQLNRYRDPQGGGLVLMLSSSASQESQALGQYSAFAKAFADSMAGQADLNHDGRITVQEISRYSHNRTHELLKQSRNPNRQDSAVVWSPSVSGNMPVGLSRSR
jgi:hypothetical protein